MRSLMEKLDWVVGNLNRFKGQVAQYLRDKDPESPVFKPSHLRKKLEDNKKK